MSEIEKMVNIVLTYGQRILNELMKLSDVELCDYLRHHPGFKHLDRQWDIQAYKKQFEGVYGVNMIKILILAFIIMMGCTPAKFIVVNERPTGVLNNCVVGLLPLNKKAERLANDSIDGALVECGEYKIGDTLIMDRKHFTNF